MISEAEAGIVSAGTSPDTGDTPNTVSWVAVMVLSLSTGILVLRKNTGKILWHPNISGYIDISGIEGCTGVFCGIFYPIVSLN